MLIYIGPNIIASLIILVIYTNMIKTRLSIKEVVSVVVIVTTSNVILSALAPSFEVGTIVSNLVIVIILTIASYFRTKILSLCAVYALFTVIISLLSANLSNVIISLAHLWTEGRIPIGRAGIENEVLIYKMKVATQWPKRGNTSIDVEYTFRLVA